MDPMNALEMQIEAYRRMTGQERLAIALRLHQLSCEIARAGIRHRFPGASEEFVEEKLRERIRMVYTK